MPRRFVYIDDALAHELLAERQKRWPEAPRTTVDWMQFDSWFGEALRRVRDVDSFKRNEKSQYARAESSTFAAVLAPWPGDRVSDPLVVSGASIDATTIEAYDAGKAEQRANGWEEET